MSFWSGMVSVVSVHHTSVDNSASAGYDSLTGHQSTQSLTEDEINSFSYDGKINTTHVTTATATHQVYTYQSQIE